MRPLDAVVARLEAQGLGIAGASIFAGSDVDLPATPGAFLTLAETGGRGPIGTHNAGSLRQPTFQVTARGDLYPEAAALADQAYLALGGGDQALVNVDLSGVFVLWMHPVTEPLQMPIDAQGRSRLSFNVSALIGGAVSAGPPPVVTAPPSVYQLIEDLGGDPNGFVTPALADSYPVGATFDALVPGSWPVLLNRTQLYAGTYVFECNARVAAVGARVKAALFNLAAPTVVLAGSEITFTASELVGERKRSAAFAVPAGDTLIGAKLTTNSIVIGGAAWGCRIVRV